MLSTEFGPFDTSIDPLLTDVISMREPPTGVFLVGEMGDRMDCCRKREFSLRGEERPTPLPRPLDSDADDTVGETYRPVACEDATPSAAPDMGS